MARTWATDAQGGDGGSMAATPLPQKQGPHAVAQFLGGESGRYVESALAAAGLATITQQVAGPTRTCTTLLHDGGSNTELIDPSDAVTEAEVAGLTAQCAEVMRGYGVIAMCGTRP